MLTLTGQLLDIVGGQNTNRDTGEVSQQFTAEVLHKVRGKSVVDSVKIDKEVVHQWEKVIGKTITVEVGFYAMKQSDGSIQKGLTLADKKCLPTLASQPTPLKAAA